MSAGTPYVGNIGTLTVNAVAITNLKTVSPPKMAVGVTEASPLGAHSKSYLGTVADNAEFGFVVFYDPVDTSHASLTTLMGTYPHAAVACVWTAKTGTTYTFNAILKGFAIADFAMEATVEATFTMQISGDVTIATV